MNLEAGRGGEEWRSHGTLRMDGSDWVAGNFFLGGYWGLILITLF